MTRALSNRSREPLRLRPARNPWRLATVVLAFGLGACGGEAPHVVVSPPPLPSHSASASARVEIAPEPPKPVCEALPVVVPPLDNSVIAADEVPLIDPTGKGLQHFYERLARVARGKAKDHVRIAIYGDSNMTMDFIAGPLRRELQASYGDGGHGFIALARPWSHYRHIDVIQEIGAAFESFAITTKPTGDGAYGIAGIVSESPSPGSKVRIKTAGEKSPVGKTASRFDVFYLKGPRRGAFELMVDGVSQAKLESEASERAAAAFRIEVPDAPHAFDSVVRSPHYVRFLGSAIERTTPGVVVDNLGVGAMNTRCIVLMDPVIAAPILEHRRYDLVILMTGTADIYQTDEAVGFVKEVVARHRAANPDVSFLLVAPPDRGVSHATRPLLKIGEQRKALASEISVGFWDLLHAMGGPTSMMKFIRRSQALPDQIHFSEPGGAWVGRRLHQALMRGFESYLQGHPQAGCEGNEKEQAPQPLGLYLGRSASERSASAP